MLSTSRLALSLLISSVSVFGTGFATAQDYPTKLIKWIVPNAPGVIEDILARVIAPEMSKFLGQSIIVENKPGAESIIGYEYVAKQVPADGYTLVSVHVQGLVTLPVTVKDLRFDPLKDLPPLIVLSEARYVFGSAFRLPWKTLNELAAYAKANPGKLNYGSSNSNLRLSAEVVIRDLGLNVVHIPYKAGAAYVLALTAGDEVQMGFLNEAAAIRLGEKFRVLAVTGEQRRAPFGDVPTFAELGLTRIPSVSFSLNVPAGIPKAAFDKLYAAASRALQLPEVKARFAKLGLEIAEQTPEAAAKNLAETAKLYADIAKKVGIQPE